MATNSIFNKIVSGGSARKQTKSRVWFYQHVGEDKKEIYKDGLHWFYLPPAKTSKMGPSRIGADSLRAAKGDLLTYEGTKVWSELE